MSRYLSYGEAAQTFSIGVIKMEFIEFLEEARDILITYKERYELMEKTPENLSRLQNELRRLRRRIMERYYQEQGKILTDEEFEKTEILINNASNFSMMKQGTATNKLTKINSKKAHVEVDPITGIGTITRKDFIVAMSNFNTIADIKTSTHKLLNALIIEFTETGSKSNTIKLPFKKYMAMRGLTDEKTARKQLEYDLEVLFNVSISFTQKSKKGGKQTSQDYRDMRLVIDKGIKRGVIVCTLHPEFYELIKSYQVMPISKKALMLNDKHNPNAYYFIMKLHEHRNMNRKHANKNTIAVSTLLDATPEIPKYEEVRNKKQAQYRQLIIKPFERDMDALEEAGVIQWEYCHTNGQPLSNDELQIMDYEIFSKLLIKFEILKYPQNTPKNENEG